MGVLAVGEQHRVPVGAPVAGQPVDAIRQQPLGRGVEHQQVAPGVDNHDPLAHGEHHRIEQGRLVDHPLRGGPGIASLAAHCRAQFRAYPWFGAAEGASRARFRAGAGSSGVRAADS